MAKNFEGAPHVESGLDGLIEKLDMGTKERRAENKLYLALTKGTVYGGVEFQISGTKIIGPDSAEFDLANMIYHGQEGIYSYLKKQAGELAVDSNKDTNLESLN